jgi:hypothetical protein
MFLICNILWLLGLKQWLCIISAACDTYVYALFVFTMRENKIILIMH